MASDIVLIVGAAIAAVPPTVVGMVQLRKSASQESVDRLHACLEDHTEQDERRFNELYELIDGPPKRRDGWD